MKKIYFAVTPLLKKYHVEKTILFGSPAQDEADSNSDIDLLIFGGEHFMPTGVFYIAGELCHALAKIVDVYDNSEIQCRH